MADDQHPRLAGKSPILDLRIEPDPAFLRSIGYRFEPRPGPGPRHEPPDPPPPLWPAEDLYFVTVCSMNCAPFTRTLVESVRRHHGHVPFVVAVVDAPSRDAVAIDGAIVLTGRDVFGTELDYAALKFGASELCCAAKPYAIDYLLRHAPARRFVYLDSDIYVFARLDALIDRLDEADFVVTPHTIAPLPAPERFWERPSLGDLAFAGVFNAGMFAMRRSDPAAAFIATWTSLVTAPGAFVAGQGGQAEQHAFNWVSCFVESFAVLRDTAYNVAYWNLHDRSLRYHADDGRWTVDEQPLVAFHFSGFSPSKPFELSKHDNRYGFYLIPAMARLRDLYLERIHANDRGELEAPYGFDRFPSGIRIDARMREIFRSDEVFLRAEASPWTRDGEAHYAGALLAPIPYTGSLAPVLAKRIHETRPDLHVLGDVSLDPRPLVDWMLLQGVSDYGYEELFDRHRPIVPLHNGAAFLSALRRKWPRLFDGLGAPVREDRRTFVARVQDVAPEEARLLREGRMEQYLTSRIGSLRQLVELRPDLLEAFPDLLFRDAPAFVAWLRSARMKEHYLHADAIDAFAARTAGESLARVFSYVSRTWPLMEAYPLALAGEGSADLARILLRGLRHTIEYDVEDVEMFAWTMDVKPWAGLPLTLELPIHTTRHPSSCSRNGQNEILAPLLQRDRRFGIALDEHRHRHPAIDDPAPRSCRTAREVSVLSSIGQVRKTTARRARRVAPGANVFGYHRSDIGLGLMTRGLVQALGTAGCGTSEIVLGNIRMDADLRPEDFIRRYDAGKGTNIFVSYPHLHDSLLRSVPEDVATEHRNIAYLAWEQRDGTHYWKDVYAEFDQVWALSDFAADSLASVLRRPVHSVPCVVDAAVFPAASSKNAHGLDPDVFTFLFIFDANSSTDRKHPEAVVDAFRRAFRADDQVQLLIKASSADRMGNRTRLQRLRRAIDRHPNIEVRVADLNRSGVYGLISACDGYVSLHRSEGFGYTCAEAMAYGKPVIATGYSGNMQFMNEANSYPVRYREVEAKVQDGPFVRGSLWAEPDVDHAAELMRRVYENRDEAIARGERGRLTILEDLSPAAIGARVRALLEDDLNADQMAEPDARPGHIA